MGGSAAYVRRTQKRLREDGWVKRYRERLQADGICPLCHGPNDRWPQQKMCGLCAEIEAHQKRLTRVATKIAALESLEHELDVALQRLRRERARRRMERHTA
jgi:hypothetical protein